MSLQDEKNFYDVTPHRIQVTSTTPDQYGKRVAIPGTTRTYRCLVSDDATVARSAQGEEVRVGLSAWCLATPLDATTPAKIWTDDTVVFLEPSQQMARPIIGVQEYYAEDGALMNMTVRFS